MPTSAMSEQIPGVGGTPAYPGSGYDPSSPTPYRADPNSATLPPITAPPPKVSDASMAPPRAPGPLNPKSKAGGIAFIADSILRGVMRGKQQAEVSKAAKIDKLSKGLQFAYQNAASRYVELVKSGADPKSKEVQEAGMAADAAWESMMGMYGNYVMGDQGKKGKKGGKGKDGAPGDPENPAELLMSKDPQDKIRGWFMISQKAGAPYKHQAAEYLTPEYQQDRQIYKQTQQDQTRFADLQHKERTGTLTEPEKAELSTFNKQRFQNQGKMERKVDSMTTPDNHHRTQWQLPDGTLEWRDEGETRGFASQISKPGSEQAFFEQVAKEGGFDVKDLSAESQLQLQHAFKSSQQMGHVSNGVYIYTDDSGKVIQVPVTRSTSGGSTTVPHVSAGAPGSAASPGSAPGSHQSGQHVAPPSSASPALPGGAKVISPEGHEKASGGSKSVRKQAEKMQPLANLLAVQTQYMSDIKQDPAKANPRSDLALVIAAVRSMNPGSVRLPNKELELEVKAGSYGQRFLRWYNNTLTGTLPADQREQLFKIIHDETTMSGENIVKDWRDKLPNEAIPSFLQQFDKGGSGGGAGGSGKVASRQHLKDYAIAKNITEQQAEQEFKDAGYTIQSH